MLALLRPKIWAIILPLCLVMAQGKAMAEDLPEGQGALLMRRDFADKMPDPLLINHRGEEVRFFTDLVQGHAVVINFFYADCDNTCPLTNVAIRKLREDLTETFGRSVRFISITVEAEKDTPEVVARYGHVHGMESTDPDVPDWQFLTGDPDEIKDLRWHLGMYEVDQELDADPSQHASMLLVGNQATGRWCKVNPLLRRELIRERVKRMIGWTRAQRYEDVHNEILAWRGKGGSATPKASVEPLAKPESKLPVLGRLRETVKGTERSGKPMEWSRVEGKVTVYGRVYSTCPHGYQSLARAMKRLNVAFGSSGKFHQVALAPAKDGENAAFLSTFADLAGAADRDPWWFVSAGMNDLEHFTHAELGLRPSLPIPAEERLNPLEEVDYDLRLVLVDQKGIIRGRYDVIHPDPGECDKAILQLEADARGLIGDFLTTHHKPFHLHFP